MASPFDFAIFPPGIVQYAAMRAYRRITSLTVAGTA
jgi:hypothetical protein